MELVSSETAPAGYTSDERRFPLIDRGLICVRKGELLLSGECSSGGGCSSLLDLGYLCFG